MIVLNSYAYIDGNDRSLEALSGFSTDGASIPRALWTFVGSPFTGKYVGSAVIHDVGCVNHKYSWQETHRMFYDAMLDSGVETNYAKLLYYGVRIGGPKWQKKLIKAADLANARHDVEAKGGRLQVEQDLATPASKVPPGERTLQTLIVYPQPTVTEKELKQFQIELKKRANEGHPIGVDEIDQRTETAGVVNP